MTTPLTIGLNFAAIAPAGTLLSTAWLPILVVAVWLVLIVLTAEALHRYTTTNPELVRKVVHIGSGNVILLAWWWQIPAWIGITAAVVASAIALISYRLPLLPSVNGVGRRSLGTFFYALSIGLLIAWFWPLHQPQYAALGILVMTWGDGLAALIGQRWGRHPYKLWGMQKSWEGSLTMALISGLITGAILFAVQGNGVQTWGVALSVALVATGLEAFSKLGIDNLTVPVGSAALAFCLNQWLLASW